MSEETLRRALEAGTPLDAIADAFNVSRRTIQRRISAARTKYGAGFGVPLKAPAPPPTKPPPIPTSGVPDWSGLVEAARGVVWQGVQGELSPDPKDRLRACEVAFRHADTLRTEGRHDDEVDHAELLAKVERAIGEPPDPEPGMSEEDLAPKATIDDGAPDA